VEVREGLVSFLFGKSRGIVVDARLANLWFELLVKVKLATGAAFACLDVDSGPPVHLAGMVIADAF
jgi:hypothetical protein